MQAVITRLLGVMVCFTVLTTGCSINPRSSADQITDEPVSSTSAIPISQESIVGTWVNEANNQRTTYTFFEDGTVQRTYHSTTMLAGQPVTTQHNFTGTYRFENASHLSLHLKGTVYNSVEGTREMEVVEQFEVDLNGEGLALKHRESDEASVFTRLTPS